jgi:lactoylglutathione lyase
MKFLWTTLYVKNLDESVAFYSDLPGLKVQRRFPAGPGMEIAFMGNGTADETLLELICDSGKASVSHSNDISVGFAVDSADDMLEAVKSRNLPVNSGPVETPAMKYFTVKDPNGLSVQFFQQK